MYIPLDDPGSQEGVTKRNNRFAAFESEVLNKTFNNNMLELVSLVAHSLLLKSESDLVNSNTSTLVPAQSSITGFTAGTTSNSLGT